MSTLDSVGMLAIDENDVINTFPQEEHNLKALKNLTQEQLLEIAPLAWEKILEDLGDQFWQSFADCVKEAAMEVLDLEYDEDYDIVEGE